MLSRIQQTQYGQQLQQRGFNLEEKNKILSCASAQFYSKECCDYMLQLLDTPYSLKKEHLLALTAGNMRHPVLRLFTDSLFSLREFGLDDASIVKIAILGDGTAFKRLVEGLPVYEEYKLTAEHIMGVFKNMAYPTFFEAILSTLRRCLPLLTNYDPCIANIMRIAQPAKQAQLGGVIAFLEGLKKEGVEGACICEIGAKEGFASIPLIANYFAQLKTHGYKTVDISQLTAASGKEGLERLIELSKQPFFLECAFALLNKLNLTEIIEIAVSQEGERVLRDLDVYYEALSVDFSKVDIISLACVSYAKINAFYKYAPRLIACEFTVTELMRCDEYDIKSLVKKVKNPISDEKERSGILTLVLRKGDENALERLQPANSDIDLLFDPHFFAENNRCVPTYLSPATLPVDYDIGPYVYSYFGSWKVLNQDINEDITEEGSVNPPTKFVKIT